MDRAENRADPQAGRDMERLVRAHDWSATPLGPRESWPQSLRTTVDLILAHDVAMAVLWGPDLIQIYNDAYTAIAAGKHPAGFGRPNRVSWPELWRFHAPIFDAVRNGETRSFEGRHLRIARHGQLEDAWFDLCFSPVRDERGAVGGILVTVVEKTKQVRAQAERARSQRLFESIADATPGILCVFDLPDDRMVYSNRSIEQILGYAPGQRATFAAVVDEALLHPEDKPRVLADLAGMSAIGPGETREHEFRMRHADGRYRWLHARYAAFSRAADGRPEQILYLAEDVTARWQAESALRMSEERFRAFFDAAPQIM